MNGPTPVLNSMTSTPRIRIATTIGASHHRLSDAMRYQTSFTKLCCASSASCSNLRGSSGAWSTMTAPNLGLTEVSRGVTDLAMLNPIGRGLPIDGTVEGVPSDDTQSERYWRDDAKIQNDEDRLRYDEADRQRHRRHRAEEPADASRHGDAKDPRGPRCA